MTAASSPAPAHPPRGGPGIVTFPRRIAFWWPMSLVLLAARGYLFFVFFFAGFSKVVSSSEGYEGAIDATLFLFDAEYCTALLMPFVSLQAQAGLGTVAELFGAVLVAFGLFGRFGAAALLGVACMIQFGLATYLGIDAYDGGGAFTVFGQELPVQEHYVWIGLSALVVLLGPGRISVDAALWPRALMPTAFGGSETWGMRLTLLAAALGLGYFAYSIFSTVAARAYEPSGCFHEVAIEVPADPTPAPTPTIEVEPTPEATEPPATPAPTAETTAEPTAEPTVAPTEEASPERTLGPQTDPTVEPAEPAEQPTAQPTVQPTEPALIPTIEPVATP